LELIHRELSQGLRGKDWILLLYHSISRQHQSQGEKIHITSRLETEGQEYDFGIFFQSNNSTAGEARQSGNHAVAEEVALSSR